MKKALALLVALFTLTITAPAGAQDATVMLAHGIPDTDVDVVVDGDVVIADFSFGDMQDLSAFAGQTLTALRVNLAGTDTVALDLGDFAVPASGNFTVVAHLDAGGDPTASVFENDTSAIGAGNGRLVVRHTAAAPAVDILADGNVAFADVSNGAQGQVDVGAGTITASVVPTGAGEPVVIGPADLSVSEGSSLIVYAVGSLDADNLSVLTQVIEGLGTAPAAVDTGNSPVSDGSSATVLLAATGLILGALVLTGVVARRAAPRRIATVRG